MPNSELGYSHEELHENGERLGIELKEYNDGIVVVGYDAMTPMGDAKSTFEGLLNGASAAKFYDGPPIGVHAYAPVNFNMGEYLDVLGRKEARRMSHVEGMARVTAFKALEMAGLVKLGNDGVEWLADVNRRRIASTISSGIGSTPNVVNAHDILWNGVDVAAYLNGQLTDTEKEEANKRIVSNLEKKFSPVEPFKFFPEEMNAGVSIMLDIQGPGLTSSEACATGLSSAVEGARLIRDGYLDIAIVGGVEDIFADPDKKGLGLVDIGSFRKVDALSTIDDPSKASRPFDRDRDGFVASSGAGVAVLMSKGKAVELGITPLAEVVGFSKSMDGKGRFEMDPKNVGRTILQSLIHPISGEWQIPDSIWAHATATKLGDRREAHAMHNALGKLLKDTPITAIKSGLGHGRGAAGIWNLIFPVMSFEYNAIPHIQNLDNPKLVVSDRDSDPELDPLDDYVESQLNLVRTKPLEGVGDIAVATAIGFGGHNASMAVKRTK